MNSSLQAAAITTPHGSLLTNADSDCRLDETGRTQQITLNSELPTPNLPLLQLLQIVPQFLHPDFPLDGGILESFHISLLYENDLTLPN